MKISILISNYNKEKYIKECILSAINQDYKDIEIIIIDNNSSDNSLKVINKFSDKVIIKKKNRISEFGAFNQIDLIIESFKISTGDVICLLDGDDFFLPNKVSKISEYFLKNKEILILFDTPHINDQNKIYQTLYKPIVFKISSLDINTIVELKPYIYKGDYTAHDGKTFENVLKHFIDFSYIMFTDTDINKDQWKELLNNLGGLHDFQSYLFSNIFG